VTVPWQGSYAPSTIKELIQALCLESSAGRLTFRAGTQMASLYLLEGRLTDAHFKSLRGLEALVVLLGFETGEYRFVSGLRSETQNLNGEIQDLFRQASTIAPQTPVAIPTPATPTSSLPNVTAAPTAPSNPTPVIVNTEPRNVANTPPSGLRTVAATLLGRIPGPMLSSVFMNEIRLTLEQLRVFNAEVAIDRAAENLGFYPTDVPSSQTKKFLTAIISEITNEQGYQFQQLLDTTVREFEGQAKANKTPSLADRAISFPTFTNPLAARGKATKPVDPAFEFVQSIQQNLKNMVPTNAINGLLEAAANDLGIQASSIAPGYAQKFVQAISQRLEVDAAQKFQRTMALSVGVYTAQR
jgi:Domain of unknown function (DUF4388)